MIRELLSFYSWRMPTVLAYMLQNTEYHPGTYLAWFWRTTRFDKVLYRRELVPTKAARLLQLALRVGMLLQIAAGVGLVVWWRHDAASGGLAFGLALLLAYPIVWAHLVVVPLFLGRWLIVQPRQRQAIETSGKIFAAFKGEKIAVTGSYGKTSMKELLYTVLSEGKKVAATPGNKNVSISHATFARQLDGDEDILIIEYGEGEPGDVARFAGITKPTRAVITGVAPVHLDRYKTLERAAVDIFSVSNAAKPEHIYVNGESPDALPYVQPGQQLYSQKNALGWKVSGVKVGLDGTQFVMQKGQEKMALHSGLLGRHQVGPVAFAAALASELGLTHKQIQAGISKTVPYEHRMQPYQVVPGAWVIDDTYNGNIEGIRAGTRLLQELSAKRKIYVTPGLVDQGPESAAIHKEMGQLIAVAEPDVVVLMQHTVTADIQRGLEAAEYAGKVIIETDPVSFYTNLNLFVATGDLVLMQNDWPDNYH